MATKSSLIPDHNITFKFIVMRFAFCVVALSLCATIQSRPEGDYGTEGKGRYFENNLDGLQGALEDISKAGEDLATLETKLEGLVDGSGLIYKAESVLENSVGKDVYINAWKPGKLVRDSLIFKVVTLFILNNTKTIFSDFYNFYRKM